MGKEKENPYVGNLGRMLCALHNTREGHNVFLADRFGGKENAEGEGEEEDSRLAEMANRIAVLETKVSQLQSELKKRGK